MTGGSGTTLSGGPVGPTPLDEIVAEWAAGQIGDDGLAQVNCCAVRIAPRDIAIYRVEEPCEARLSPDGKLLVLGIVYRYEAVCPACAAEKTTGEVFMG